MEAILKSDHGAGPACKGPLTSLAASGGFVGPAAAHWPPDWKPQLRTPPRGALFLPARETFPPPREPEAKGGVEGLAAAQPRGFRQAVRWAPVWGQAAGRKVFGWAAST